MTAGPGSRDETSWYTLVHLCLDILLRILAVSILLCFASFDGNSRGLLVHKVSKVR